MLGYATLNFANHSPICVILGQFQSVDFQFVRIHVKSTQILLSTNVAPTRILLSVFSHCLEVC